MEIIIIKGYLNAGSESILLQRHPKVLLALWMSRSLLHHHVLLSFSESYLPFPIFLESDFESFIASVFCKGALSGVNAKVKNM